MLTLDRYIIGKYLSTFFFTALLFSIIAVTIDFSEHIENFIEQPVTKKEIIFDYYLNFIPWINGLLWPIFSLIAVIFFTSRLARNTEVVAMLNSGMSYIRFLRPYLISSCLLALIYLMGNHIFFPIGNKKLKTFDNTYISPGNIRIKSSNIHLFIGPETKVYIATYQKHDSTGTGFRLEKYDDLHLTYVLNARTFEYLADSVKWRLRDYDIRKWVDGKEYYVSGKNMQLDTSLPLYPSDFVYFINDKEMMTSSELLKYIHYEEERGVGHSRVMRSEYHRRWAEPFTIIILTVIGASVASRKQRGGMGLHLAVGVCLGAFYVLLSKFALTFSTNLNMPPMLAMWTPNLLFGFLACYLVNKAQK
ncbi:MAG TPA: LptF/LptG family permease [Saprospiraceae bacterium]|nr:LptF/LptG family permease [Saprospiraceae bacterium]